jgi:prephenate dehydratase
MTKSRQFGVFGDTGSFSEAAATLYAQNAGLTASFVYLPDMEDLLAAVGADEIDIALFPVVNFRGGIVKTAFEAMGKYSFSLVDSLRLNVQHCLLVRPGTSLKDVKKIATHHAELIAWNDTAGAARDLASEKLPADCAVIASAEAAKIYSLEVAAKSIQDDPNNYTVFVIVQK